MRLQLLNELFVILSFSEYLQELNDTGSFPDELEKTPMCFIKCYLESLGVLGDENMVNTQKTVEVYQLNNDELVEECRAEISEFLFKY